MAPKTPKAPKAPAASSKREEVTPEALMARVEELTAELKAAKKGQATEAAPAAKKVVKGTRHYRLLTPHYRDGRYLERGEFITVTDEPKSPHWLEVKDVPRGEKVRHTVLKAPVKKVFVDTFDDEVEELAPETDDLNEGEGGEDDENDAGGGEGRPSDEDSP